MSACRRFEEEGLLALEQERPLGDHFQTCPECRRQLESYQRLKQVLAEAPPDSEPRSDWQERVWAQVETSPKRSLLIRRWIPAAVAAAASLFLVLSLFQGSGGVSFEQELVSSSTVRRGQTGQPGDRLTLKATTGGASHAEFRVYRGESQLVLRCSTESPCLRRRESLEAVLVLETRGRYQPVLLLSEQPIPAPESDLDGDAGAAGAAGARVELGEPIEIR